jgi:hypothetical protein
MNSPNQPNARASRASRKRTRAPGNAPAPGTQAQKRQKPNPSRQSRKRAAKRGRDAAGRQPAPGGAGYLDADTRLQHTVPEMDDVLEKDEFVADVLGSGGVGNTVITKYSVNPAQASLFPLGSPEASKWTCWKCVYCEPYLMHEVSQTATDGQTGKVILAMDYNAANDVPTTKQQLEAMHSASCMPYQDIGLNLIPKLMNKADPKYIRPGIKPAGTDIRLYDGGNLYVASIGQTGSSKIAELRVRYKFQLCLPTLLNPSGGLVDDETVAQFYTAGMGSGVTGESVASSGVPQNLQVAVANANGLAAVNTAGSIVPPAGSYRVSLDVLTEGGATNTTFVLASIAKNGTSLVRAAFSGPALSVATVHSEWLVQCNGTDALTFPLTVNFGSSTVEAWGNVLLELI